MEYMGNKKEENYASISIPTSLIKEIDKIIGKLGYVSRSEFIKEAVREKIIKLRTAGEEFKIREIRGKPSH